MKKLKSLWLTITGSLSSAAPSLFACCKSTACVGVCASPVASLFGISTAGISNSPLMTAIEPLLIAVSAVSFTVSYYTLYVLPKFENCSTKENCGCTPSDKEKRKTRISKYIFWIGLTVSTIFLSYFEFQKYKANTTVSAGCEQVQNPNCCPESAMTGITTDSVSGANGSACCDTSVTNQ